jgi:hypothetical protein
LIRTAVPLVALIALALAGCASTYPTADTKMQGAEGEFDVPPRELVSRIKQALNEPPLEIGVTEEDKGSILTGYQQFPGTFRVARRWQERTRYRIRVIPDFDQPTQRAQVVITENTEQRAGEGMKWESSDVLPRPQRAADLLTQLRPRLEQGSTTHPSRTAPAGGSP